MSAQILVVDDEAGIQQFQHGRGGGQPGGRDQR